MSIVWTALRTSHKPDVNTRTRFPLINIYAFKFRSFFSEFGRGIFLKIRILATHLNLLKGDNKCKENSNCKKVALY